MKLIVEITNLSEVDLKNLIQELKVKLAMRGTNATFVTGIDVDLSNYSYDNDGLSINDEISEEIKETIENNKEAYHSAQEAINGRCITSIPCPECKDKKVKHCTTCYGYGKIDSVIPINKNHE